MTGPEHMLFGTGLHSPSYRRPLAPLRVLILCAIAPAIIVGQTGAIISLLYR
jgi:hypothetical protein